MTGESEMGRRYATAGWTATLIAAAMPAAGMAVPQVAIGADAGATISVRIAGRITPACTMAAQAGNGEFGTIADRITGRAEEAVLALPFSMDCNTPYEASLASANGGLAYQGQVQPAFAALVEYAAALDMGGIAGAPSLTCTSIAMRVADPQARSSCRAVSAGSVGAKGSGWVRLRLKSGPLRLQMGEYSDLLTLRIAPRISG